MNKNINYSQIESLWKLYDDSHRQLAFKAETIDEWKSWHRELKIKLVELLGGFPSEKVDLDVKNLMSSDEEDFQLEKVAFQSYDGVYIPCWVLKPRNVAPPYRPVIALHGHGSGGADHTLGIIREEGTRKEEEAIIQQFNYEYSKKLAQHGYMVFAPTLTGFGDRMETLPFMTQTLYSEYGDPMWLSSCRSLSLIGMLLGKTTNGMRVWDVMRTIDYIQSRSESFIDGVGCMGLSGGGMTTMYASAVEPRISVSVVNGYFSTFRDSIMSVFHCTCNYIPEIVKYAEMSDIAGLIAPRPLLVVSGTEDDLFPVGAVEAGFAELQKIYGLLDVPEKLDKDIYKGGHRFSDNKVFNWFDRWLK